MPDISFPPNQARFVDTDREIYGWDFDDDALAAAVKKHGIQWDIELRFSSSKSTNGSHSLRRNGRKIVHRIILVDSNSPEKANESLWHELRHAIQAEKVTLDSGVNSLKPWDVAYGKAKGKNGTIALDDNLVISRSYYENQFEIDARNFAEKHKSIALIWH